jgi:methyl-accepting chemotaxis protein
MTLLRRMSIQKKLLLSMGLCLLLFLAISSVLSVAMTGQNIRERVINLELPAQVGEIRNDIQRQIALPLAVSMSMANNTFLQDWENEDLPEAGMAAWQAYAKAVKDKNKAATVFWISASSGKYLSEAGLNRTLEQGKASDQWFYGFLSGGKPYTLDLDKDASANSFMLFINTRVDTAKGKKAVAGLGLSVEALADTIRAYKIGKSGFVYLVRANGGLLIHRDAALADGKHMLKDLPGFNADISATLLGGAKFAHTTYQGPAGPSSSPPPSCRS